ncbi:MAG: DCC1-like thiol-disulfide oxidoreductase family protein [Acidobacteriota bacterium]
MVERIFYDGDCGVCHWAVEFVSRRDGRGGEAFRFAPLDGETFATSFPHFDRAALPDSVIVQTEGGRMLLRSEGVVHILHRLGGTWRLLGGILRVVPRFLRDGGYDLFARVRHRFVKRPEGVCPILPPELRGRFDP